MIRSLWRTFTLAALVFGLVGCGSSSIEEGIPANPEPPKPINPADFIGKGNMGPRVKIPKPGTPGTAVPPPAGK